MRRVSLSRSGLYCRAMPKSMRPTAPSSPSTMFSGLMSRWITGGSRAWSRSSRAHTFRPMDTHCSSVQPPAFSRHCARVWPGRKLRTKKCRSPWAKQSAARGAAPARAG